MNTMPDPTDDELVALLRTLRPAPAAWVAAASEIPRTQRELDAILHRIAEDEPFRKAVDADLERALREAGYPTDRRVLDELRDRLRGA
jgi:hypothetical protein